MPTVSSLSSSIRLLLNHPNPSNPDPLQVSEVMTGELQNMHASLANTRPHWDVDYFDLAVSQGVEDYPVGAANFGKMVCIHSIDPQNTYHYRIEVPVVLLEDADQLYRGPQQTYSSYPWSATEMIVYRRQSSWYIRPVPIPGYSAFYRCWFDVNTYTPQSLSDSPPLESFHNLIKVRSALALLPYAAWGSNSMKENMEYAQMLGASLSERALTYQRNFDRYIGNLSRGDVHHAMGYGAEFEGQGGIGVGTMASGFGI